MPFCEILSDSEAADRLVSATGWPYSDCLDLIEYLDEVYEDCGMGEVRQFDPVAIRCDWSYYETPEEAATDHGLDSFEELEDLTTVLALPCGGAFVEAF
jgi:hypothetical protein